MGHRDSQEPPNPRQCGVPSGMGRMALQDWQWLRSPTPWQAGYKTFCPPFPINPPPDYRDINSSALPAATIKRQDGEAGKRWDAVPPAPAWHVPQVMLCAAALGAWAAGSAGAPAPSLRTPPFACSPKDHIQIQIARLHPPPPVKSIIRRHSPACGLLFLGRERERATGSGGEGGAGGGFAFDSCYFSDWRGLAGKGTWYKGCAQQGWSVRLPVCVQCCSSQHRAGVLSVQRAGRARGVGYGGRGASLECPKHPCSFACQAPGDPCTLVHACASRSSISPCPARLQRSLLAGSPGLSLPV